MALVRNHTPKVVIFIVGTYKPMSIGIPDMTNLAKLSYIRGNGHVLFTQEVFLQFRTHKQVYRTSKS